MSGPNHAIPRHRHPQGFPHLKIRETQSISDRVLGYGSDDPRISTLTLNLQGKFGATVLMRMKLPWLSGGTGTRSKITRSYWFSKWEASGSPAARRLLEHWEKSAGAAQERIAGTDVKKTHGRRIAHRQIGSIVCGKVVVDFQTRSQVPARSLNG